MGEVGERVWWVVGGLSSEGGRASCVCLTITGNSVGTCRSVYVHVKIM